MPLHRASTLLMNACRANRGACTIARMTQAALLISVFAACGDNTGPDSDQFNREGYVRWIEAEWTGEALHIRVLGSAGCAGLQQLDLEVVRDSLGWSDVIIQPRAYPRPERYCLPQPLDTSVRLQIPEITGSVEVWATFPWEPGLRGFVTTSQFSTSPQVGGLAVVDTVRYGCATVRALFYGGDTVEYAVGPILMPSPVSLTHGAVVFVGGDLYPMTSDCNGLPVLNVRTLQLNPP